MKYLKFFESSKYDSIYEDVKIILNQITDDLGIHEIDNKNDPWGPGDLVRFEYKDGWLNDHMLNGIYSIDFKEKMNMIKIDIRFNSNFYLKNKNNLIKDCIEEIEERFKDNEYDFEKLPTPREAGNVLEYIIYLGKWHHWHDGWVKRNTFISD